MKDASEGNGLYCKRQIADAKAVASLHRPWGEASLSDRLRLAQQIADKATPSESAPSARGLPSDIGMARGAGRICGMTTTPKDKARYAVKIAKNNWRIRTYSAQHNAWMEGRKQYATKAQAVEAIAEETRQEKHLAQYL